MVLNEDALEAMIRRQNEAAAAQKTGGSELAEKTDEFEVYERPKEEAPEPVPSPAPEAAPTAPSPTAEFEEFSRAPVQAAPQTERVEEIPSFRDSFAPAQPAHEPSPELAPAPHIPSHAPTPQAQATAGRAWPQPPRIAVVQARFNEELTGPMAEMAMQAIQNEGGVVHTHKTVAGVYDLPLVAQNLARRHDVDGVVVLGVVVKGSTKHDEIITHCTAKTLQEISLETQTPIGLGITGPGMTWEQAEARMGNAAHAVTAVMDLLEAL